MSEPVLEKNFQDWLLKKETIHKENELPIFKEGEIWWAAIGEEQYAALSQIRMMSAARLYNRMGSLSKGDFTKLKNAFRDLAE